MTLQQQQAQYWKGKDIAAMDRNIIPSGSSIPLVVFADWRFLKRYDQYFNNSFAGDNYTTLFESWLWDYNDSKSHNLVNLQNNKHAQILNSLKNSGVDLMNEVFSSAGSEAAKTFNPVNIIKSIASLDLTKLTTPLLFGIGIYAAYKFLGRK